MAPIRHERRTCLHTRTGTSLRAVCLVGQLLLGCAPRPGPASEARAPTSPAWLACTYSASNQTRTVRVEPTADPYGVQPLDVAQRFLLKFVYVTSPQDVAGLRVYAYEVVDDGPPVLLHESKYRVPFVAGTSRGQTEVTGQQRVYARSLSRELAYSCAWVEP